MKKIFFPLLVFIVLLSACVEPAYHLVDVEKYPTISEFPEKYRGTYMYGEERLKVDKTVFAISSTSEDIPKSGQLGYNTWLRKHGTYDVVYYFFANNGASNWFHLRFFSLNGKELIVRKIKRDDESLVEIKKLALETKVEADPDGFSDDQYYYTINGEILNTLMERYLMVEYTLTKVN